MTRVLCGQRRWAAAAAAADDDDDDVTDQAGREDDPGSVRARGVATDLPFALALARHSTPSRAAALLALPPAAASYSTCDTCPYTILYGLCFPSPCHNTHRSPW